MLCQLSLIGQTTINEIAAKQDQPSINNIAVIRAYGLNSFDLRDYSMEGSPYLKDHWCNGEIELYDGKILDDKIRPAVARDGGDIKFKSFKDGVVHVELQGSCSGCPSSLMTLKQGVQNLLCHYVEEVKSVEAI